MCSCPSCSRPSCSHHWKSVRGVQDKKRGDSNCQHQVDILEKAWEDIPGGRGSSGQAVADFIGGPWRTNACGSGVSSSFFVLYKLGLVNSRCEAICLGGNMEVYIDKDVYIKSSPKLVYKGVIWII